MYAQFRSQYPMGSLISELLNIHEGKFIVRASIQVGGSTLATGLSAAANIEQAEDQARVRALVVLGIEDRPYATTQAQIVNAASEGSTVRGRARLPTPAPTSEFLPLAEAAFQESYRQSVGQSVDVDWAMADQAAQAFPEPEQQMSWFERSSADSAPPPPQPQLSGRALGQELLFPQSAAAPARPFHATASPEGNGSSFAGRERRDAITAAIAAPVDLSDIIAHTDIELKRLGWTNAQGRRYLEQTYGKRSRQHLSDAELMEFLDYLKTQPAPAQSIR
jgi:hypothetical protein